MPAQSVRRAKRATVAVACLGTAMLMLDVAVVNRTPEKGGALAARFGPKVTAYALSEVERLLPHTGVLANASSLGAIGQPGLQIDLGRLHRDAAVCDINYVPLKTALLATGMVLMRWAPWSAEPRLDRPLVRLERRIERSTATPGIAAHHRGAAKAACRSRHDGTALPRRRVDRLAGSTLPH